MAKKKSHTGFRNNELFCFNCGRSYKMNLPAPVSMASAMMLQFDKDHHNCPKTWTEPVPDPEGKTEEQNYIWWLQNGERGISSETMFTHLSGISMFKSRQEHPQDPNDFSRCYKLLKAVPQWRAKLDIMKPVSPAWKLLVENWDKLTEMYEQNVKEEWKNHDKIGMYEFMQSLLN